MPDVIEPHHQIVTIIKLQRLERLVKILLALHVLSLTGHGLTITKLLGFLGI